MQTHVQLSCKKHVLRYEVGENQKHVSIACLQLLEEALPGESPTFLKMVNQEHEDLINEAPLILKTQMKFQEVKIEEMKSESTDVQEMVSLVLDRVL